VKGELMKKTAWSLLVFVSLALATRAQQTNLWAYSEELGLWVGIIEDKKLTEEELFRRKMRKALPYISTEVPEFYRLRTLGQLTKISDCIVVGEVVSVDVVETSMKSAKPKFMNEVSFSVKIVAVLLGDIAPGKTRFEELWPNKDFQKTLELYNTPYMWHRKKQPQTGDRVLMFLLREPGLGYDYGERAFAFKKTSVPKDGAYHIARGNDGMRHLDTPENATNYLNAVKGYLEELRGEKRNPDSYYSLLSGLIQSPVQSIREDARSDLMYFIETCPSFDARRVLTDDNIDEAIKYWVEHSVLPPREKQQPAAQKEADHE